jgi:hypothetical protein
MAEKLAERFGHDANVIGWQIDNEYANSSYGTETKGAVSAVAAREIQDACKPERALDDGLLERELSGLGADTDSRGLRESRVCF